MEMVLFVACRLEKKKKNFWRFSHVFFFNFDVLYLPARRLWRGLQELYQKCQKSGNLS